MVLKGLDAARGGRKIPPVHLWNPPFCGDIDMVIRRDGVWMYEGSPIGRQAMVALFASVLRKDGDDYFLVTPVEKVGVTVEDAPFLAVAACVEGSGPDQRLIFTTNVGDEAEAGPEHAIRVEIDPDTQQPSPYIHIRADLEAKIVRSVFYDLVELGEERETDGVMTFGIWSGGVFFPVAPADEVFVA